ncbi:MAG: PadR family transcriptional regulator [Bryobacteraceae bacterium]|nr:PadR family transcriptional regulator [Bryobacteraceae bacterium]
MHHTLPTALILQALERGYRHGFDIMDATGLPSGTVYPALRRLEKEGLVTARWEQEDAAHADNRPARRYYELNEFGEEFLSEARGKFRMLSRAIPPKPKARTSRA